VSGQEEISVGFMQWNWRSGSLVDVFMKKVPQEAIDSAPSEIRPGVQVLKELAADPDGKAARAAAARVVKDWSTARPGDPLVKGRLRGSVVQAWARWLGSPPLRSVQAALIDNEVATAFSYAAAWKRDLAGPGTPSPVDARTMAYFFDMVTFNNSTKGAWADQVKSFRNRFPDNAAIIEQASAWLARCESFTSPPPVANRKMYGGKDATATAARWRKAVSDGVLFSDDQIDLLIQALLRAQQSVGSDPPRGFPGIYQAEVLTRGGAIALGLGRVHGTSVTQFP
jgi:hypothetical protein